MDFKWYNLKKIFVKTLNSADCFVNQTTIVVNIFVHFVLIDESLLWPFDRLFKWLCFPVLKFVEIRGAHT
jgi:hypothetical protein